jgi:hypothetical protein
LQWIVSRPLSAAVRRKRSEYQSTKGSNRSIAKLPNASKYRQDSGFFSCRQASEGRLRQRVER